MTVAAPRVRVGLIGLGSNGEEFLRAYHEHPHAAVMAIATRNPERRATLSARYEVPRSVSTADELLQLDDIDLVSIHVPDHLHAALTLAALAAGKHVFVEKPLGTNVEEITTVIERADASGKLVAVGHVLRTWPHFRRLKVLVDCGRLGYLYYVAGHYLTNQARLFLDLQQKATTSYSPAILTLGVHIVDIMRWLAGDVVEVQAMRNDSLAMPGTSFDDCAAALFRFQNGAVGHVATCWTDCAPGPATYGVTLRGSRGTVEGDRVFFEGAKDWQPLAEIIPDAFSEGGFAAEVEAVIACLRSGSPVPCNARDGGRSAIAGLAAAEAARRGAAVAVPRP